MNTANIGRQSLRFTQGQATGTPLFGAAQTGSDDALVEHVYRLQAENGQLRDALDGLVEAVNRSGPKVLSEELRQAVEEAVRVLRRVGP